MPRLVKPAPDRRRDILDFALALFLEKGYETTTVADIVARAGLSKGAFYHHFAAKDDLLEALAERFARQSLRGFDRLLSDPSLNAFEKLEAYLVHARNWKREMGPQVLAAFTAIFRPDNLLLYHRIHLAGMRLVAPVLTRIIAEGIADRVFDTPDAESAADMMLLLAASTHDATGRVLAAKSRTEREAALSALAKRIDLIGIAADRLLGLPDGSIRFADADFVADFDCALPALEPLPPPRQRRRA